MNKEKFEYITYLITAELEKADDESKINLVDNELDIIVNIVMGVLDNSLSWM